MFPFEKNFTVIGKPTFEDPTEANRDFGKCLEALAATQGLSFGETGLYAPFYFPDYDTTHFEYRLFRRHSTGSDYEPISFDYFPRESTLRVYSAIPEFKVRPIVDFIATHYLGVSLREKHDTPRGAAVRCHKKSPRPKRFGINASEDSIAEKVVEKLREQPIPARVVEVAKPKTIGEVPVEDFWSRFNKEKNKAKIGKPSADDHAANGYTQSQIAAMFGPPCNAEKVANWESKARGSDRGSVPPSAMYKGRLESYREELRKFPIGENVEILAAIIKQYKATEGVKAAAAKAQFIHCRSEESLYQARARHGA